MSKLAQMPKGEKYDIENCPFYEDGKRRKAMKGVQMPTPNTVEVIREAMALEDEEVEELYNLNLSDADISYIIGVSSNAIAKWRRQKGLIRSMSKDGNFRKVDWNEINAMISEGYSDIAVAIYVNVPLEVIQKYKIHLARRKANGGEKHESDEVSENPV